MTLLEFNALTLISAELEVREALNGVIFITCLNISLLLIFYLYREWRIVGRRGLLKEEGIPSVILQLGLFSIIAWRSGVAWFSLHKALAGFIIAGFAETFLTWSLIISGIMLIGWTLRATYLYAPAPWCHRTWIANALLAIIFILIT